jgi:hypothetical protein
LLKTSWTVLAVVAGESGSADMAVAACDGEIWRNLKRMQLEELEEDADTDSEDQEKCSKGLAA